ncbi:MAG: hypothetical protein GY863_03960, partial [bacterium]|nr:hypothetical protein [bacterium]
PDKRDEFIDLLKRYNVNAIFTAHEHLYEHSILSYAGDNSIESGKIHFIITGGGGVPLRKKTSQDNLIKYLKEYEDIGYDIDLVKHIPVHHYCLVDVKPDLINIRIYQTSKDIDRKLIEEIIIEQ